MTAICQNTNKSKVNLTISAKHAMLIMQSEVCKTEGSIELKTKLAQLRKEKKLSQEELALALGVTRQTITSIEVGKYTASLPLAFKIAYFFGLAIEEVFDFSEIIDEMEDDNGKV